MSDEGVARPANADRAGCHPGSLTPGRFLRSPVVQSCLAMYGATAAGFGLAWIVSEKRHQNNVVILLLLLAHACAMLGLLGAAADEFLTNRREHPDLDSLRILIVSSILAECFILVILWQPARITGPSQARALLGLLILCSVPCLLTIGPAIRRYAWLAAYSSAGCFATYVAFLVLFSGLYAQAPN